jgi:hypothetical protein
MPVLFWCVILISFANMDLSIIFPQRVSGTIWLDHRTKNHKDSKYECRDRTHSKKFTCRWYLIFSMVHHILVLSSFNINLTPSSKSKIVKSSWKHYVIIQPCIFSSKEKGVHFKTGNIRFKYNMMSKELFRWETIYFPINYRS